MFKTSLWLLLLAFTVSAWGQALVQEPPPELTFLSSLLNVRKNIAYESWSEVKFPPNRDIGPAHQGKHWFILAETTHKETDPVAAWNAIKSAFPQNGWTVVKEYRAGGFYELLHYAKNGVEAWANMDSDGSPVIFRLDVIEAAPPPISLTLATPSATPETIAETTGDFPYLMPLPGSKFHSGGKDPSPFWVLPKGASQKEMVAPGSLNRSYRLDGLSNLLFVTVYHDALTKAGWEIVDERSSADVAMTVHYSKNGRNLWAALHNNSGGYDLSVADAGGVQSLTANLSKSCHVALYGVLFDFNKSTLQPASDATLQQVAGLLTADKTLKLEVQGHTDNVGNDAYNQTLSEARAKAVMGWLTQHGVTADRLTAKGYGKTVPVADNTSEEGRAKNRRVEIADPRCSAKGK